MPMTPKSKAPKPLAAKRGDGESIVLGNDQAAVKNAAKEWLDEHPEGKKFTASDALDRSIDEPNKAKPAATPTTDESAPRADVTPATEAPGDKEQPAAAAPVSEAPADGTPAGAAPEAKPTEQPVVTAEVKPEVKPADKPVDAGPTLFDRSAQYRFTAGGPVWSGDQVSLALFERERDKPRVEAATRFEKVFGCDVEAAEREWKPVVERLVGDPGVTQFIDQVLWSDPGKLAYLADAAKHYDSLPVEDRGDYANRGPAPKRPGQPDAPVAGAEQYAKLSPADQAALKEARDYMSRSSEREAAQTLNTEVADAIRQYPFLGEDQNMLRSLLVTAQMMNQLDGTKTLKDAVAANRAIYDAIKISRTAAASQPAAPIEVPALNGTSTPGATAARQRVRKPGPTVYSSVQDAVKAHLAENPDS